MAENQEGMEPQKSRADYGAENIQIMFVGLIHPWC